MDVYLVAGLISLLTALESASGLYFSGPRRRDDWIIDFVSIGQFALLVKPAIVLTSAAVLRTLAPRLANCLAGLPLWLGVLVVLFPDELLHYWYHRKGHEWNWLWKIHRTHHTTPDLNVWVPFRENVLWFVLMPNLWYAASTVYLGLGAAYAVSNVIISVVDIISHSGLRYDDVLYRLPLLRPATWFLERVITLPDTHHAHHGQGRWSNPMGNYATLLFFFDVIFGTAQFPHHRPESYGIRDDPSDPWYVQLYWPFVRASDPRSELARQRA